MTDQPTTPGGIELSGEHAAVRADLYSAVGARRALTDAAALLDAPPITEPQAQGDVFVLPWPADTNRHLRERRAAAATPVPPAGTTVDPISAPRHDITPTALGDPPRYLPVADTSHTLGVLVVPDGAAATLAHPEHPDLHIGPGVYILHGQRAWTPAGPVPAAD